MQMGEKARFEDMAAVLANATATTLVYPSVQGPARARIAAAVYVSPELYSLPVSQEFASLRPPLGGRTRLV